MNAVDTGAEFAWRKKLWFEIGKTEVEETLKNCSSNCLLPFFKSCGKEGFELQILEVLDQGTCNCRLLAIHIFSTPGFFEREAKKKLERQKKKGNERKENGRVKSRELNVTVEIRGNNVSFFNEPFVKEKFRVNKL